MNSYITEAEVDDLIEQDEILKDSRPQIDEPGELYKALKKQIGEGNRFEVLMSNDTFLECHRIEEEIRAQNLKTAGEIDKHITKILNNREELYTACNESQKELKCSIMKSILRKKLIGCKAWSKKFHET